MRPFPADLFPYFLAWREKHGPFYGEFFLDSFKSKGRARYSYFPLSPPEKIFSAATLKEFPKAWQALQNAVGNGRDRSLQEFRRDRSLQRSDVPFQGGAVGILSYDAGRFFEPGWRSVPPPDPLKFPLMHFGIYRDLICLDHQTGRFHFFSKDKNRGHKLKNKFENIIPVIVRTGFKPAPTVGKGRDRSLQGNKEWFLDSVKKIKNLIAAGDIYQANLSQRIERPFDGNGLKFFSRLRIINPSPYAFYFKFGGFEVASCSPELLIKKRGQVLETRPIAGTRPRGRGAGADAKLRGELLLNAKERAEHVMLLDLERNDLGRVCRAGSVRVTQKMAVEKYSHVMHIVSHVRGTLRPGEDFFSALAAAFPGGTITGAPKARCMEILDEIEPAARGPFYGSAGWMGFDGDGEMNLLIRTALIHKGKIALQVGSGIVADSDPKKEYEESLHKARALLAALS